MAELLRIKSSAAALCSFNASVVSKPGKLFFTCPTCTGSKYYTADNKDVEWSQVTIDTKVPKYTVMDVSETTLVLTTYDLSGNMVDLCSVTKQEE